MGLCLFKKILRGYFSFNFQNIHTSVLPNLLDHNQWVSVGYGCNITSCCKLFFPHFLVQEIQTHKIDKRLQLIYLTFDTKSIQFIFKISQAVLKMVSSLDLAIYVLATLSGAESEWGSVLLS